MRKLVFILLSILSLTAMAQEKKTISIQRPQCGNAMVANMVKSSLTKSFALSEEWQPVEEMSFEQMLNMDGNSSKQPQFMLMTSIQNMEGIYYISCRIMDTDTMATIASAMEMSETSPQSILDACNAIAKQLIEN